MKWTDRLLDALVARFPTKSVPEHLTEDEVFVTGVQHGAGRPLTSEEIALMRQLECIAGVREIPLAQPDNDALHYGLGQYSETVDNEQYESVR